MDAVGRWLKEDKAPGRRVRELDNRFAGKIQILIRILILRGSNFYLATYWASCLAQKDSSWQPLASKLQEAEQGVVKELVDCQVLPPDLLIPVPATLPGLSCGHRWLLQARPCQDGGCHEAQRQVKHNCLYLPFVFVFAGSML